MLTTELRIVNRFSARRLISFTNMMASWWLFLDPHLTPHYSNKGVQVRYITKLGLLTL
jgi:hypothetical protein